MKDNFSKQSLEYSKYRPSYPEELIEYLLSIVRNKDCAWDCGTGSGQLANLLADHFKEVFATDISENQIKNAVKRNNIIYKIEKAEETSFPDSKFDLITVAQAIHWFDFDKFYDEVRRTLKHNGFIAVIGYHLPRINYIIDKIVDTFYTNIVGKYWDEERKYIDEYYKNIPFPFKEIETPQFTTSYKWSLDQLIGFLSTWSATQHYKENEGSNPIDIIREDLECNWNKDDKRNLVFPIIMRVGKVK